MPAVTEPSSANTGFNPARLSQGGVRAVAVVALDDAVEDLHFTGGLVFDPILHRHRHDFIVEQPGGLGLRGTLLALQRIQILCFAADIVTTRDDFGGLAHREVDARHLLLEQRVDQVVGVDALHGQADGLDATGDDDVAATRGDLVGGNGDRLQARRAEPVEGHAGGADAQARQHRDVATDVVALGAFVGAGADDAVLDAGRVDTGARQQRIDTVGRHVVRAGHVELAAKGFGQAGPHAVDDHHFTHGIPHCCCRLRVDRA